MLALELSFLNGWFAAKRPGDEYIPEPRPEWPPHPVRLYYALAAAFFEGGQDLQERQAMEWLEAQQPPRIWANLSVVTRRVETYVPSNDVKKLSKIPAHRVKRYLRSFVYSVPHDPVVTYVWPVEPDPRVGQALDRLCARVAAVGHSSSFVRLIRVSPPQGSPTWQPVQRGTEVFRVPFPGLLDILPGMLQRYTEMGIRGELPSLPQPYAQPTVAPAAAQGYDTGVFEKLWILRRVGGPLLPAIAALGLANALRRAVMARWPDAPIPEDISGHDPSANPSQRPHVAFVALPAAGHQHSDGHLLGVAVALPRDLPPGIATTLWQLLKGLKILNLKPGPWHLELVEHPRSTDLPYGLQAWRWCQPARIWASVTPVVLDRYPDDLFGAEAEAIIRDACQRTGLPDPEAVMLTPTSIIHGVPPARDFPPYPVGSSTPRVHVVLIFPKPVSGPVLIGRGRYRGMGLFAPVLEVKQ